MEKHAYLIMAHQEWDLLRILLELIDDERNDIYLHIDKKANINKSELITHVKKSKVFFSDRINVMWGGVSQIKCELTLLKKSVPRKYEYYHLLSGQDLPIKSQDFIHDFFKKNKGMEFIRFNSESFNFFDRVKYYHFFINRTGRSNRLIPKTLRIMEKISLYIQKKLRIDRIKGEKQEFQKGTNWFSITHELANYVVENSDNILREYQYTLCCDEIFLQTLVLNSHFINNLYYSKFDNSTTAIMRLIDWERGNPYVFKKGDFEEIMNSNMLFARKFSLKEDAEIVNMIVNRM